MDKKESNRGFIKNSAFSLSLPANSAQPAVLITSTKSANGNYGVDLYFYDNGLTVQIMLNSLDNLSWLSFSISLDANVRNYNGAVEGLMGDFDGNPNNDIKYANGALATSITEESIYYNAALTCILFIFK